MPRQQKISEKCVRNFCTHSNWTSARDPPTPNQARHGQTGDQGSTTNESPHEEHAALECTISLYRLDAIPALDIFRENQRGDSKSLNKIPPILADVNSPALNLAKLKTLQAPDSAWSSWAHTDSWAAAAVTEIAGRSAAGPIAAASPTALPQAPGARFWAQRARRAHRLQAPWRSRLRLWSPEAVQAVVSVWKPGKGWTHLTAQCVDKSQWQALQRLRVSFSPQLRRAKILPLHQSDITLSKICSFVSRTSLAEYLRRVFCHRASRRALVAPPTAAWPILPDTPMTSVNYGQTPTRSFHSGPNTDSSTHQPLDSPSLSVSCGIEFAWFWKQAHAAIPIEGRLAHSTASGQPIRCLLVSKRMRIRMVIVFITFCKCLFLKNTSQFDKNVKPFWILIASFET